MYCVNCNERLDWYNAHYVHSEAEQRDIMLCDDCYREFTIHCACCGRSILHSETIETGDGRYECQQCYKHIIKEYHYHKEDKVLFYNTDTEEDPLYMGIELEVVNNEETDFEILNDNAENIAKYLGKDFVYMETDGSLDDSGFEIITQPATLKYHTNMKDNYKSAFKYCINNNLRSHDTGVCGLHVHFNRDYFSDNEDLYLTRLLYLTEKFWDELSKFSRRTSYSLNHWAKRYNAAPEEVVEGSKYGDYDRYYAINLTNINTVEFRIFRGTLRLEIFIATLQLVDTMVKKCKSVKSAEELQSINWEDLLIYDEIKNYWETVKNRNVR